MIHHRSQDIQVALSTLNPLNGLHLLQLRQLIPTLGGLFKTELARSAFHFVGKSPHEFPGLALEKQCGLLHLLRIVLITDQADAGARTATDLILQTGAGPVAEITVLALADLQHLLQEV